MRQLLAFLLGFILSANLANAGMSYPATSSRPTYVASVSGAVTTAAYNLQIESGATLGFKVTRICVSYSLGAAAAGTTITTTVQRRTTASTLGTALTNEGTATTSISKLDPSAAVYSGLGRGLAATLGTAGAAIDQWSFPQTVNAGTTGVTPISIVCRDYGLSTTDQPIIVAAGAANGLSVNVSAGGAGSLSVGTITMWFVSE